MKLTERERVQAQNTRARMLGLEATLTETEWNTTIADFNDLCAYCLIHPFTVLEHFIPLEHKAGTTVHNCLPACQACNWKKKYHPLERLTIIFGKETIERLQVYLANRTQQPDTELPQGKSKAKWTLQPRRKPGKDAPYQILTEVAKELGIRRESATGRAKRRGIKTYRFALDPRIYIATQDVPLLKERKRTRNEFS